MMNYSQKMMYLQKFSSKVIKYFFKILKLYLQRNEETKDYQYDDMTRVEVYKNSKKKQWFSYK